MEPLTDLLHPVVFALLAAAWVPAAVLVAAAQQPADGPAPDVLPRTASRALALVVLGLLVAGAQSVGAVGLVVAGDGAGVHPLAWPLLAAVLTAGVLLLRHAVPALLRQRHGRPLRDRAAHAREVASGRAAAAAGVLGVLLALTATGSVDADAAVGPSVLPLAAAATFVAAVYVVLRRGAYPSQGVARARA